MLPIVEIANYPNLVRLPALEPGDLDKDETNRKKIALRLPTGVLFTTKKPVQRDPVQLLEPIFWTRACFSETVSHTETEDHTIY